MRRKTVDVLDPHNKVVIISREPWIGSEKDNEIVSEFILTVNDRSEGLESSGRKKSAFR